MRGVGALHSFLCCRVLGLTSVCSVPQHTMAQYRVTGCSVDYGCNSRHCTACVATHHLGRTASSVALLCSDLSATYSWFTLAFAGACCCAWCCVGTHFHAEWPSTHHHAQQHAISLCFNPAWMLPVLHACYHHVASDFAASGVPILPLPLVRLMPMLSSAYVRV
jgi:hypothetical protein